MAIVLADASNVRTLYLDTEADVAGLKDLPFYCAPGSSALVIESGNLYMLNSLGEWRAV